MFYVAWMRLMCRTDSIMLLEEGFNVMSTDASDKMLKYALRQRWARRKEFDSWGESCAQCSYSII